MSEGGFLTRPSPSSLGDVVETVLAKGLVIDAYARVSLLGIELVTVDARIVVASVDTHLRFAEATNRLDLAENSDPSLVEMLESRAGNVVGGVAGRVAENKVDEAFDKVGDTLGAPAEKVARVTGKKALELTEKAVGDQEE